MLECLTIHCLNVYCLREQKTRFPWKIGCILCKHQLSLAAMCDGRPAQLHTLLLLSWESPWHARRATALLLPFVIQGVLQPPQEVCPLTFPWALWGQVESDLPAYIMAMGWQVSSVRGSSPNGSIKMFTCSIARQKKSAEPKPTTFSPKARGKNEFLSH